MNNISECFNSNFLCCGISRFIPPNEIFVNHTTKWIWDKTFILIIPPNINFVGKSHIFNINFNFMNYTNRTTPNMINGYWMLILSTVRYWSLSISTKILNLTTPKLPFHLLCHSAFMSHKYVTYNKKSHVDKIGMTQKLKRKVMSDESRRS